MNTKPGAAGHSFEATAAFEANGAGSRTESGGAPPTSTDPRPDEPASRADRTPDVEAQEVRFTAIERWQTRLDRSPEWAQPEWLARLARPLPDFERRDAAETAREAVGDRSRDRFEHHEDRARSAERSGRWADAVAHWRRAIEIRPDQAAPRIALGLALELAGRLDEADAALEASIEAAPDSPAGPVQLANFARRHRRWVRMEMACSLAAAHCPNDPKGLIQLSRILASAGDYERSLYLIRRYRGLRPTDHFGWYAESWLLEHMGERDAHLAVLDEARSALADRPAELALFLDRIGAHDEARSARSAVIAAGDQTEILDLAAAYRRLGRLDAVYHLTAHERSSLLADQKAWLTEICARTGTSRSMLRDHVDRADPMSLTVRVLERIASLARVEGKATDPPRNVALCNLSFAGIGGGQRSTIITLAAIGRHPCPFERVTFVTGERSKIESAEHSLSAHLDGLDVEVRSIDQYSGPRAAGDGQDQGSAEPWQELLAYLPDEIRDKTLGLYGALLDIRPDVAILWGTTRASLLPMGLAAVMARVGRVILSSRGIGTLDYAHTSSTFGSPVESHFFRRLVRALLVLPQFRLMVPARHLVGPLSDLLDLDLSDAAVIPNGIVAEFLGPETAESPGELWTRPSADCLVVGGVFRLCVEKQPMLWLEMAARVRARLADRDVRFIIVGGGQFAMTVRRAAEALGLSDCLTLVGENEWVRHWLAQMDLFVLTSKSEGCPNSVIEAQYFGVPVVTTDMGPAHEVICDGETGWIVDRMDAEAVADRVCWCLARPDWLAAARRRARAFARSTFALERMRADLIDLVAGSPLAGRPAAAATKEKTQGDVPGDLAAFGSSPS
jgi:glycosyltransferase involved in cell wall biosynthesis